MTRSMRAILGDLQNHAVKIRMHMLCHLHAQNLVGKAR